MIVPTLLLFLLLMAGFFTVTVTAAEIVDSGYCGGEGDGKNLTWTLSSEGTLKIGGAGTMKNYSDSSSNRAPWYLYGYVRSYAIRKLVIFDGVTSIGEMAFSSCRDLKSITIPDSVTSIGSCAFMDCRELESVTIPDRVTSVKDWVFAGCSKLTSIEIPNSVTSIGNSAFSRCSELTNIEIPNSVTSIGERAFYYCALTSIEIPNSVTSIGESVFALCSRLTNIEIPNSVTSIGVETFLHCSGLTSIKIPDSITSIGEYAFYGCSALTSVEIPNNVTSIGTLAFCGCSGLTSVAIPDSVTSIGGSAFEGCSGLTSVEIPDSVTSIRIKAFKDCSSLTSVEIPDSVTSIDHSAFEGCSGLTSIEIPDSVTSIGYSAFKDCSGLTSVEIPNSVTSIGGSAFYGCSALTNIYFSGSKEQWDAIEKTNSGLSSDVTIHYESTGLEEPEKSLTFDKQSYTAKVGETIALSATFLASRGPTDMKWFCDDTEAVSLVAETSVAGPFPDMETTFYVSHQMVGNKAGTYEITLTASGLTATTTLVISEDSSETTEDEVSIARSEYSISIDETGIINADSRSGAGIHWKISGDAIKRYEIIDESIAPPEDGWNNPEQETSWTFQFIGVHAGQATITAYVSTGESASCVVTVEEGNPYYISLSSFSGVAFEEGKTQTIEAQLCSRKTQKPVSEDELKSVEQITWESSDGNVVAFDKEGHTSLKFEDNISHGFWGNNHDKVKLYGRGSGGATVSCYMTINGYVVYSHTTVTVYSKGSNEIISGVEKWKRAYESYVQALEAYLDKYSKKGNAISIEEQGELLMLADLSKPRSDRLVGFVNTADEADDVKLKYVYQAVAQFLADKSPNSFEKIGVKDVDNIAGAITRAVLNFVDTRSYPYNYSHGGKPIYIEISGISAGTASFRKVVYNGEDVAHIISRQNEVLSVLVDYVGKLIELDRDIVKLAYKEALKEVFGKDIGALLEDSVKERVAKSLGEYASRFAETGINDIVKDFQYCIDYYGHLKKVFSLSTADPWNVVDAMSAMNFDSNPDNIKDYTVKKAMKALKTAGESLEDLLRKAIRQQDPEFEQGLTDLYDFLFHFHCPITIAVYSGDVQVGLLSEDDLWYNSDYVYIEQYGEEKNVYAHSGTALRFEVVGTDEGTLDYIVEEFKDGESVQRMNYYDINLYEGKTVSINSSGATITDDDAIRSESEGEPIFCDETLTADDYETASVLISSLASPHRGGQVQGCGSYVRGDRISLRAVPENAFLFKGWWSNEGELVSLDRIYEFTAREDVNLTAMFVEDTEEIENPDAVVITSATLDKADGLKVRAAIQCPENINATAYCAFYKSNGQMVSVEAESLQTGENDLTLPVDSSIIAIAKIYVLDERFVPQCQYAAIEIS